VKLLLLLTCAALSACGPDGAHRTGETGKAPESAGLVQAPAADCSAAAGDSARAVCLATRPEFPDAAVRSVLEVVRRGDTICVHTGPGELRTDDEARVLVVRGVVVETTRSDSIGCR
jgi:hypothetical protein